MMLVERSSLSLKPSNGWAIAPSQGFEITLNPKPLGLAVFGSIPNPGLCLETSKPLCIGRINPNPPAGHLAVTKQPVQLLLTHAQA